MPAVDLSFLSQLNWVAAVALEVLVLVLAWRGGLFSRLRFFSAYLALLLLNDIAILAVYRLFGFRSLPAFYTYWIIQGLCISLRAAVVYEICRLIISPFVGIWRLVSPVLVFVAVILIFSALITTRESTYRLAPAILAGERGLELVVLGILVAGLLFCRYYGIKIDRYLAWLAFGLGFYSAVQVADNTFLENWLNGFAIWEGLRHFSFNITLAFWGIALRKPLLARQPAPILLTTGEYDSLTPRVTARLRTLNTRLLEMWK